MYPQTQLHPSTARKQDVRPPTRCPKSASKRWVPYAIVSGFAAAALMLLACAATVLLVAYLSGRIPNGVTVAGIPVGGEQADQAQSRLAQALAGATVALTDDARSVTLSLAELGIHIDTAATIEKVQNASPGAAVTPVYQVDLVQAQSALISLSQQINVEPVPGDPPQMGRSLDIPVLLDRLRSNLAGEVTHGVIELPMFEVAPPEPEPVSTTNYTGQTTTHVVEPGQELGLIAKLYNVSLQDLVTLNGLTDPDLLYVGQSLTIPAAGVYEPSAADAPPPATNAGKAIVVSVGTQRIFAYENGQLVHSHLVSTGLPQTPTVLGDYSIYVKYLADDMSGPGYFLPQVPYTMYFYSGYAIHGTYWHNAFGREMSHGCVNLPVNESEWFFNWAQVGTPVRVVA